MNLVYWCVSKAIKNEVRQQKLDASLDARCYIRC